MDEKETSKAADCAPPIEAAAMPPNLAMAPLFATGGLYPAKEGDPTTPPLATTAMVRTLAADYAEFGAPLCQGQIVPVSANLELFSVILNHYGGDGQSDFALPDLRGRAAVGGPIGQSGPLGLGMTWMIAANANPDGPAGFYPALGALALFAGSYAPPGWLVCDGSQLPIESNLPLYNLLGQTFGGAGGSFALPNLVGRAPVGVGAGPGLAPVALGQTVAGSVPGLGLNYLIDAQGRIEQNTGPGAFPDFYELRGEIYVFAGTGPFPPGWAPCDGTLLRIGDNPPLFQLIGNTYGGDGETTFALPDLRGRMVTGLSV